MKLYFSEFGDDIKVITDHLNKHGFYPDSPETVFHLWHKFSDECYCANWLIVSEALLDTLIGYIMDNIRYKNDDIKVEELELI